MICPFCDREVPDFSPCPRCGTMVRPVYMPLVKVRTGAAKTMTDAALKDRDAMREREQVRRRCREGK